MKKKIFITGGCGYIGGILIRKLLADGFKVACFDLLIYGDSSVKSLSNNKDFELIKGDIRDKEKLQEAIKGSDAIVHLAAIVGDKPCDAAINASYDINFNGTKILAEIAKKQKIGKFIFASTCSNYGISNPNEFAKETSSLNPVSLYAESKIDCEEFLRNFSSEKFKVVSLRFGTAYGMSYRTRFDLTVNSFAYEAFKTNKISVFAHDTWRPYIHVQDICNIIIEFLKMEKLKENSYTFNAGYTDENYTKKQVVEKLIKILPDLKVEYISLSNDKRNYKVDFTKIENFLKNKRTKDVNYGFKEILNALKAKNINDKDFYNNNLEALVKFFKVNQKKLERKFTYEK